MQYGVGRHLNQVAAVVDSIDVHPGWQKAEAVDLVDLRLHALNSGNALGAAPHEDDALDDVIVGVVSGDSEPGLVAEVNLGHIREIDGYALIAGEQRVADVIGRVDQANAADHCRLRHQS